MSVPKQATTSATALYKRLLGYAWPYRGAFILAVLAMALMAGSETGFAILLKPIMDSAFVEKNPEFVERLPLLLIGVFLLRAIGGFVSTYGMAWVARKVVFDLRQDMFSRLLRLPTRYYDRHASATLMAKLVYDVEQVAEGSTRALTVVIKDTLASLALFGWLVVLNWKLTLVFGILLPLITYLVRFASKRFRQISLRIQDSIGTIAHVAKEAIQGHRIVKSYGSQEFEDENFRQVNNQNRHQAMKRSAVTAASVPVAGMLAGLAIVIIIAIASRQAINGQITAGEFVSYLGAMLMMLAPVRRLAKINEIIQAAVAAAGSLFALIDEPEEPQAGTQPVEQISGALEIKELHFRYSEEEEEILKGVSFSVPTGSTVALVGPSGSGKSTLAALLMRFYSATRGRIESDSINILDIPLKDWRRQVALVTQETVLFDDTIARNITYGSPESVDSNRLFSAAHAARVDEFADHLGLGLDTRVGEHGVLLSGGQRQRITIARALYKNTPLLVLDEATSSLDSESEHWVQQAIRNLSRDRTTIIVAHRLSTIEHADEILVLDQGLIVERGTHAVLLARNGLYAQLYHRQDQQVDTGANSP